jgi:hypothetical protein
LGYCIDISLPSRREEALTGVIAATDTVKRGGELGDLRSKDCMLSSSLIDKHPNLSQEGSSIKTGPLNFLMIAVVAEVHSITEE